MTLEFIFAAIPVAFTILVYYGIARVLSRKDGADEHRWRGPNDRP